MDVDEGGDDMVTYIIAQVQEKYDILGLTTVNQENPGRYEMPSNLWDMCFQGIGWFPPLKTSLIPLKYYIRFKKYFFLYLKIYFKLYIKIIDSINSVFEYFYICLLGLSEG